MSSRACNESVLKPFGTRLIAACGHFHMISIDFVLIEGSNHIEFLHGKLVQVDRKMSKLEKERELASNKIPMQRRPRTTITTNHMYESTRMASNGHRSNRNEYNSYAYGPAEHKIITISTR